MKIQIDIETQVRQWFESKTPENQLKFLRGILKDYPTTPVKEETPKEQTPKKEIIKQNLKTGRGYTKKPTVLGRQFESLKKAAEYHDIPYHKVAYRWSTTEGNAEKTFKEAYAKAKIDQKGVVIRR